MMKVLLENEILHPRLIDIVLDGDHIKPSLKDHKNCGTRIVDRERKLYIEAIFRLLVM